jgi:putative DNA primase/helicase
MRIWTSTYGKEAGGTRMPAGSQLPLALAKSYMERQWRVLPVPFRAKAPNIPGWQKLHITTQTLPKYFNGHPQNIGVLLGQASGNLVDVDLDCDEALAIASFFLPATGSVFGRASTPDSHWLYITNIKTQQFVDPIRRKLKGQAARRSAMLVEIRSTGAQTVFPGSTHESGEVIDWSRDGLPSAVQAKTCDAAWPRLRQLPFWRVTGRTE